MPAGAPRTVTPDPEDMIALGEEMVKWVIENKPIHLSMWYTQVKDFTDHQWAAFRKVPEFVHYYTKALKLVGYSYLDKDSQIDVRLKDRWQRVYFKDLREEEDQDARDKMDRDKEMIDYEAAKKMEALEKVPENIIEQYEATMAMMRDARGRYQSSSDANKDFNKNSKDK